MKSGFSSLNELWGQLVIEELIRCGINCFVVSPGSRSTPLVYALSQNKSANSVVHFDERGSAFYALGHARATGMARALICTSGTAGANYMPAIIEASVDHVPLIVLTADRPPELRHSGANQTIDQVRMCGNYVRWFFDIPCPDENIPSEFVLSTVDQAVFRASNSPQGPVHLNFMFRVPLAPDKKKKNYGAYLKAISSWTKSSKPYTEYVVAPGTIPEKQLRELTSMISGSKSGLIVAGKMNQKDAGATLKLSEKTSWPIFPDIASRLRLGVNNQNVIPYYDMILATNKLNFKPTTVLHFGNQPVSKRLLQFLENVRPENYVRVINNPERLDPNHQVTLRLESDISDFCTRLSSNLTNAKSTFWKKPATMSRRIDSYLSEQTKEDNNTELTEPTIARSISKNINKAGALFLASSLPVREMDMFAVSDGPDVPVEYNRGASGIDGTIASAVGFANGLKKMVTVLIGDLAFLHDLNSLDLVRNSKQPLVIIVLNNDGGGIFSFLPVAEIDKDFEKFFGTPHGLTFENCAKQFGLSYDRPETLKEFADSYKNAQAKDQSTVLEITTDRKANHALHRKIIGAVKNLIDKA